MLADYADLHQNLCMRADLFTFLCLLSGLAWACQPAKAPATEAVPPLSSEEHCYSGASPYGTHANYLIDDYLEAIDRIQPDPTMARSLEGMIEVKGERFDMGADNEQARPDEFPKHPVEVKDFWIDATEVTNAQFQKFIEATGYVTVAERVIDLEELKKQVPPGTPLPSKEDLQPFSLVFKAPGSGTLQTLSPADWWQVVKGANWRQPQGPGSSIKGKENYPVVHVSWYDAIAYCKWTGKRLPSEAEWEYAARSGQKNKIYPWGNEPVSPSKANFFQGEFPVKQVNEDGFVRLAPVKSFPANTLGLYDMAGNVWEWCADWYRADYYAQQATLLKNPQGPADSYDPDEPATPKKVVRGGSFLCNDTYCSGYRVAARMKSSPDTGLEHTGFRCVRDKP